MTKMSNVRHSLVQPGSSCFSSLYNGNHSLTKIVVPSRTELHRSIFTKIWVKTIFTHLFPVSDIDVTFHPDTL